MSANFIADVKYCDDDDMNYMASRRLFRDHEPLVFDEAYRMAHLPLVAPEHPLAIRGKAGTDYVDGRYTTARHSLVVQLDCAELASSAAFQTFELELRSINASAKISWELCHRRAENLHATIVNSIAANQVSSVVQIARDNVAQLEPLLIRIGGPFMGRINSGRIYFPLYPQKLNDCDPLGRLQIACGRPASRFYVAGYYHFRDELTPGEAKQLAAFVGCWQARTLAVLRMDALAILATNDDLALSGRWVERIPIGKADSAMSQVAK